MSDRPRVRILGTGRAVPAKVLTNADLEGLVETTDRWIVERTGIRERHVVEPGTPLSVLAEEASRAALEEAGTTAEELDLIVVGTVSGDMKFPAAACFVQERLGAKRAAAFDISAACSGFLYSLQVAEGLMAIHGYQRALVIGGDILTSMVDWSDRDTCVLFGDGAGAVVLGDGPEGPGRVLATCMGSNGAFSRLLYHPGGGSLHPLNLKETDLRLNAIRMEGREVFRHAVLSMVEALQQVLDRAGLQIADLDLLIPHQANLRIIEALGKRFGLPAEKVYVNVDRFGNTSAASIPIALDEARRTGRIEPGHLIGMVTFGAGFTWASGLVRF